MNRPPLPTFTNEFAREKVRLAEDGWNTRDAAKVALAYTADTNWRNRSHFVTNRDEAQAFLADKWKRENDLGSSSSFGHSQITELLCAMRMSGAMTVGTGFALMETKIGSLTQTV